MTSQQICWLVIRHPTNSPREMRSLLQLEITPARLTLVIALLCALLGSALLGTSALSFIAAVLAAAPFAVALVARVASRQLRVSRQLPPTVLVGDLVQVRLSVVNAGVFPVPLVHLRAVVYPTEKKGRYNHARNRRRNRGRNRGGNRGRRDGDGEPLWVAQSGEDDLVVPILWPSVRFQGEIVLQAQRRGVWKLAGAGAGALDPLGLSAALPARSPEGALVVCPRPLVLPRLAFAGGVEGEPQPRRGSSVADATDLHGVRPYRPGEGIRRVHWKATARSGQLHVVEWEEEAASDLCVLIDVQKEAVFGPRGDDTLEASVVAAASVAAHLLERARQVRLFWWEQETDSSEKSQVRLRVVEARHRAGLRSVLESLANVRALDAPGATLGRLASAARAAVREDDVALVLCSDRADWKGALQGWGRAADARVLCFDCASFAPEETTATASATSASRQHSNSVVATKRRAGRVRLVRRGEPLSAVFERDW